MNRIATLLVVTMVLLGMSGVSVAQHDQHGEQAAPPQTSSPSGMGAGGGMMGHGEMSMMQMMAMMQTMHPAVAVDGSFIYIVRGSQILKLDKSSLRVVATATLPAPPSMGAGMGGMAGGTSMPGSIGGAGGQGMMQRPEMQEMMGAMAQAPSGQFEQSFLRNMSNHHAGAIAMSRLAVQRASRSKLRGFAQKVISDQSREIRQFAGWMKSWYNTSIETAVMPMDTTMVGNLQNLDGREFDIEYMQMMIQHHQEGVQMARMAEQRATHPELKAAAAKIVSTQSAEIDQLRGWLSQWYNIQE